MKRTAILLYGALAYMVFLLAGVALVAFLFQFGMEKTLDRGGGSDPLFAFVMDVALIGIFGLQHSWMARPKTKSRWSGWLEGPAGRSSFVLASSLALGVLVLFWQPLPNSLFSFESPILRAWMVGLSISGWVLVIYASSMIDPWDLIGLRQVTAHYTGTEYKEPPFLELGIYRYIRHPIMTGLFLAFWATPDWTVGRVLFAGGMSLYIWIGVFHEERDMAARLGVDYTAYQAKVGRFIPRRRSFGWEWEDR